MNPKWLLLAMTVGSILYLVALVVGQTPATQQVQITAHTASGVTYIATATANSISYTYDTTNGQVVHLEYTTPELLCSGFGQRE